jgi:hypothetical protein
MITGPPRSSTGLGTTSTLSQVRDVVAGRQLKLVEGVPGCARVRYTSPRRPFDTVTRHDLRTSDQSRRFGTPAGRLRTGLRRHGIPADGPLPAPGVPNDEQSGAQSRLSTQLQGQFRRAREGHLPLLSSGTTPCSGRPARKATANKRTIIHSSDPLITPHTLMPPTGRLAVCAGVPERPERSPVHRGGAGWVRVLVLGRWRAGRHGGLPAAQEAQLTALKLAALRRPARRRPATGSLWGASLIAGCGTVAAAGTGVRSGRVAGMRKRSGGCVWISSASG